MSIIFLQATDRDITASHNIVQLFCDIWQQDSFKNTTFIFDAVNFNRQDFLAVVTKPHEFYCIFS